MDVILFLGKWYLILFSGVVTLLVIAYALISHRASTRAAIIVPALAELHLLARKSPLSLIKTDRGWFLENRDLRVRCRYHLQTGGLHLSNVAIRTRSDDSPWWEFSMAGDRCQVITLFDKERSHRLFALDLRSRYAHAEAALDELTGEWGRLGRGEELSKP